MKTSTLLLAGIFLALWGLRSKFATSVRVKFPALDADYWQLSPNRQYWIGGQGERVGVIRMPDGEILPPPPLPKASTYLHQGVMR